MKKFFIAVAALALGAGTLFAQNAKLEKPFYLGIQGGPMFSLSENAFSYRDNGKTKDLFSGQASFVAGYDFTWKTGVRLSVNYAGKNASANNVKQTSGDNPVTGLPFFPYTFKSINTFVDVTHNISNNPESAFIPKVYAGIGLGHTYDFTDSHHPWQTAYMTSPNNAFGFRFGFIAEYLLPESIGIYADITGEAYTDTFNGLRPGKEERKGSDRDYEGYPGFPLDLRGLCSFGVAFHF